MLKSVYALLGLSVVSLMAFVWVEKSTVKFDYPKRKNTTISMELENFSKFQDEWKGTDYYYISMSKDSIICSVLYYKLNTEEQEMLVTLPQAVMGVEGSSPAYPAMYFSNYSKLREYEKNIAQWGEPTDDFMFRQADILEIQGYKVRQKNMYAYCMFDKDLFVNIHLSKVNYQATDSIKMRAMLASLLKQKP